MVSGMFVLSCLGIILLTAASAIISGAEVALFSLNPNDLENIRFAEKRKKNVVLINLLKNSKELLATVLIFNNFFNISIIILSTYWFNLYFEGHFFSRWFALSIQIATTSLFILIFGEIFPKLYAINHPLRFARFFSFFLFYCHHILKSLRILSLFLWIGHIVDRFVKKKAVEDSVEYLAKALKLTLGENQPHHDHRESKILKGIIQFGHTEVAQIMTPRPKVLVVNIKENFQYLIEKIIENSYSRMPIYEEKIDYIKGVLYTKDLLPYLNQGPDFNWTTLIRSPFFVPVNKKIDDLLKEFQSNNTHLAIALNEYGELEGVVTIEDVLEEIVGEISDEFDQEEAKFSRIDSKNFMFEADIVLADFYKILEIEGDIFEKSKGKAETLAGFFLEITGKMPQKDKEIYVEGYKLKVESIDKRRIKQIKITIPHE